VDPRPEALRQFVADWSSLGAALPCANFARALPCESPLRSALIDAVLCS